MSPILNEVWKSKVLAPALRRWSMEIRRAILGRSRAAEERAFFATQELAPLLICEPGARYKVDGLVVWVEGGDVRFEFEGRDSVHLRESREVVLGKDS